MENGIKVKLMQVSSGTSRPQIKSQVGRAARGYRASSLARRKNGGYVQSGSRRAAAARIIHVPPKNRTGNRAQYIQDRYVQRENEEIDNAIATLIRLQQTAPKE